MKVHLWDAYNPNKISVDLNKNLKDKIRELIGDKIYSTAKILKIHPTRLYDYFIYQKTPIPLSILLKISKLFNIPLLEIEKNIILYKNMFVPLKNSIKNPKLPLEIDPYFTSLIANLFFDGSVPEDGKGTYYHQKDEKIMNDFISKVKTIFGDVQYSLRKDHRGVLKCRLPRLIGEICREVYKVNSFGTFNSRVPDLVYTYVREHKLAFILTGILDEGSITYDGSIQFGVSNKNMVEDFKRLCNDVGLNTSNIGENKLNHYYYLYIKSPEKFYSILQEFNKKYPLVSLRYKKERLKDYLEIKNHPGLRNKTGGDDRKRRILLSLKEEKTINSLSKDLLILPRSLRRHLDILIKRKLISKRKIGRENYFYLTFGKPNCFSVDLNSE